MFVAPLRQMVGRKDGGRAGDGKMMTDWTQDRGRGMKPGSSLEGTHCSTDLHYCTA
jgi:hypothetical protein